MRRVLLFLFFMPVIGQGQVLPGQNTVKKLKITILSTMLAQQGTGEWGSSALVEADSASILFDAGSRENTVLENARELNIDLSKAPVLILSHNHGDHTGGWLPLRNALKAKNPGALSHTYAGRGLFDMRISASGEENMSRKKDSLLYTKGGGKISLLDDFVEILPGVYLTGPVPRKYPEKNYSLGGRVIKKKDAAGNIIEDIIPEDMSLVVRTEKGLVLLSGCGHSGIVNTLAYVRQKFPQQSIMAAIGGFHLLENSDDQIKWTAGHLRESGIRYFMGAHCTGIEPVFQLREWAGLKRGECIVGAVGAWFDPDKGFVTGPLAR